MNNLKEFRGLEGLPYEVFAGHPGLWFKDLFNTLSEPEQIALLALHTLSMIPERAGKLNYVTEKGIARIFNADEEALGSVLAKAQERGIVQIVEKAIVPCLVVRDELSQKDQDTIQKWEVRGIPKTKPWVKYRSMRFPLDYEYLNECRDGYWVRKKSYRWDGPRGSHPLDKEIYPALRLLVRLMDNAEKLEIFPTSYEIESPFRSIGPSELPEAAMFYDERFGELNSGTLALLEGGLSLWHEPPEKLLRTIWWHWKNTESNWIYYLPERTASK